MEAKPGVSLRGGVGQIAELRRRERQRAESVALVQRRASGRVEGLRGGAVTMERVRGSAAGVITWAESADLERRGARRCGEQVRRRSNPSMGSGDSYRAQGTEKKKEESD